MAAFLSFLQPARDQFFRERAPQKALSLLEPFLKQAELSPFEMRAIYELAGLILVELKQYTEAASVYQQIGEEYQAGYCAMLKGDLFATQACWTRLLYQRANHWAISLYGMVTMQLNTFPTMLQVRNHLETDVYNLIQAQQTHYLENLLSYVDFLTQMNMESPKFIGRALMHAGLLERAEYFLLKGQKALPNDPEVYYHLGQYYAQIQQREDARLMLNQCLLISPTYSPALELLGQVV